MAWPVSDRFLSALRLSHDVVTTVDVYRDGVLLREGLPITGGTVTVDEGSKVRRTVSLTVGETGLDPAEATDLLAPFGTELHVRTGVRMTEGDVEDVPVGVFRIETAKRSGWLGALTVSGGDRSTAVQAARFLTPENTAAGAYVVDEIARLIHGALPDVEVFDLTNSQARTVAAAWDRDRWDAVCALADSIGAEVFFDPQGRALIRPVPTTTEGTAVWEVDANTDTAALLDLQTGLSSEGVYNAVVAEGETQTGAPAVLAVAYLTTGPLAWRPGFAVPRFFSSRFLQTVEQCATAASALLVRSSAFSQEVSPVSLPNPALEAGDLIGVTDPDGNRTQRLVAKFDLPLGPGAMPISTRVNEPITVSGDVGSLA